MVIAVQSMFRLLMICHQLSGFMCHHIYVYVGCQPNGIFVRVCLTANVRCTNAMLMCA